MESVSLWQVITGVMVPILSAVAGLMWTHIRSLSADLRKDIAALWVKVNANTDALANHRVDCEQRYARNDEVKDLKDELVKRLDRMDAKLDRALPRC